MSSISSIGSGMSISGAYITPSNQLSEATKAKLEALGIDPASVTSEAEAQSLIAQVESMSKTDKARPQSGSSDMALLTKAKELAEDVGAKVSERDNLDDICKKISEKIERIDNLIKTYNLVFYLSEMSFSHLRHNQVLLILR